jgi:CheY-like chemotaxis protein
VGPSGLPVPQKRSESLSSVESLLRRGLSLYGHGQNEEAVACWRAVLELVPDHPEALDYLQSAGVGDPTSGAPLPIEDRPSASQADDDDDEVVGGIDYAEVLAMLREKRFDEALVLLYLAHDKDPRNRNISRIIGLVKERLIVHQRRLIGNMDAVPRLLYELDELKGLGLARDDFYLARRIDGMCTVDDLASVSQLAINRTLECLLRLIEQGVVALDSPRRPSSGSIPVIRNGDEEARRPPQLASLRGGLGPPRMIRASEPPPIAAAPMPAPGPRVVRAQPLVLYADPDPLAFALGKMMLQGDFEVISCATGPEAMTLVRDQLPDLLIVEFMLSGMDGARVVHELRRDPRTGHMPVILVANPVQLDFARSKIGDHRLAFLPKPFDKTELRNQVRRLLAEE